MYNFVVYYLNDLTFIERTPLLRIKYLFKSYSKIDLLFDAQTFGKLICFRAHNRKFQTFVPGANLTIRQADYLPAAADAGAVRFSHWKP